MAATPSILNAHQTAVLKAISEEPYFTDRYYLTGGTALAEFYLQHRLSEDFDFFSEKQEVDPLPINQFWEAHAPALGVRDIEFKRVMGLYTYFLHFTDGEILKVDFNYYPFARIEKKQQFGKLEVDSIYDIAVNKVHTVMFRNKARDFIDIYSIVKAKGFSLGDLLKQAKVKFDWHISALELGARLRDAANATDLPKMILPIEPAAWRKFFVEEAAKLKPEILG